MVRCVVVGCDNHTDPRPGSDQEENISIHRILAVHDREGKEDYELRKRRRDGYLAAINRKGLDLQALCKYRICSKHFVYGKSAELYKPTKPNWLPTIDLGSEDSESGSTPEQQLRGMKEHRKKTNDGLRTR